MGRSHQVGQDFIAAAAETATRLKGSTIKSGPSSFTTRFTLADTAFSVAMKVLNTGLRQGLQARAGLHYGTTCDDHHRPYDSIASKADQTCNNAGPGELLLTGGTLPYLCDHFRDQCVRLQGNPSGNKAPESAIYACKKQAGEQTLLGYDMHVDDVSTEPRYLFLTQGDREFFVSPDSGKLLIGRAPDCHIVLQGNRCSRNHALIDAGKDNYVLLDQSTNGTYVENQYSEVLALSRQSTNLSGSGKLFFGGKSPENVQDIIEYQISTAAPD
jgi:hypothetical protein